MIRNVGYLVFYYSTSKTKILGLSSSNEKTAMDTAVGRFKVFSHPSLNNNKVNILQERQKILNNEHLLPLSTSLSSFENAFVTTSIHDTPNGLIIVKIIKEFTNIIRDLRDYTEVSKISKFNPKLQTFLVRFISLVHCGIINFRRTDYFLSKLFAFRVKIAFFGVNLSEEISPPLLCSHILHEISIREKNESKERGSLENLSK